MRNPYLALLPVGLAVPVRLPVPRWALTPPFHPYPSVSRQRCAGRFDFCGAFPRVAPAGRYPAPLPCGVRTFLASGWAKHAAIQFSARGWPTPIIRYGQSRSGAPGWPSWPCPLRQAQMSPPRSLGETSAEKRPKRPLHLRPLGSQRSMRWSGSLQCFVPSYQAKPRGPPRPAFANQSDGPGRPCAWGQNRSAR